MKVVGVVKACSKEARGGTFLQPSQQRIEPHYVQSQCKIRPGCLGHPASFASDSSSVESCQGHPPLSFPSSLGSLPGCHFPSFPVPGSFAWFRLVLVRLLSECSTRILPHGPREQLLRSETVIFAFPSSGPPH